MHTATFSANYVRVFQVMVKLQLLWTMRCTILCANIMAIYPNYLLWGRRFSLSIVASFGFLMGFRLRVLLYEMCGCPQMIGSTQNAIILYGSITFGQLHQSSQRNFEEITDI